MMVDAALIILGLIGLTFSAMLVRAALYEPKKLKVPKLADQQASVCPEGAEERLAGALRAVTVNLKGGGEPPSDELMKLHRHLKESFPLCFGAMKVSLHNDYSLLLRWNGSDTGLEPVLMMGHLDVVPVEESTIGQWDHGPFSGEAEDGFIWGRGALDCKNVVLGLLESAEALLKEGFTPKRTLLFAFGHDEETGGMYGAASIADALRAEGTGLYMILDEGGRVDSPGIFTESGKEAIISVAEKGYASFKLEVDVHGGHSSRPSKANAPALLIRACDKVNSHVFKADIGGPFGSLLASAGPYMGFWKRLALANLWITGPFVRSWLSSDPHVGSLTRTTAVVTMMNCGVKDNVIPAHAEAVVNTRPGFGQDPSTVMDELIRVIADSRVKVTQIGVQIPPSRQAKLDDERYGLLAALIEARFPGAAILPAVLTGGTDTKHYADMCDAVFRFVPVELPQEVSAGVHGINERIPVESYRTMISFYMEFMRNASSLGA